MTGDQTIRDLTAADIGTASGRPDTPSTDVGGNTPQQHDALAASLLPRAESERLRDRWRTLQGTFVDEPRAAVEEADHLVAELMERLTAQFSATRTRLEERWEGHGDVSTEDLRVALTQYRSFFERLLTGQADGAPERSAFPNPQPTEVS